jgi:hypothetical protein
MQCPRCDFENNDTSIYCERCGTHLQISTPYSLPQSEYITPSPPLEYGAEPSISGDMQAEMFANQKILSPTHPGITLFRVIRSVLYFIAAPIAALGLLGTFNAIFGTSNLFEGLAIFFALGLLVGSVVIFLHMRYRDPKLRLAQFIWSILGATVGWVMATILVAALTTSGKPVDFGIFFVILLYGLLLAAISLW